MCLNLLGVGIGHPEGRAFALKVLEFLREFCRSAQERTGNLYNLEATPAEGCSYRLARIDKAKFPGIIVANEENWKRGAEPYYTNSTHLPVDATDDPWEYLEHQDELQCAYTGGTVVHIWIGEEKPDPDACAEFVKKVFEGFRLPYLTLTPTYLLSPYSPGAPVEGRDAVFAVFVRVCRRCSKSFMMIRRSKCSFGGAGAGVHHRAGHAHVSGIALGYPQKNLPESRCAGDTHTRPPAHPRFPPSLAGGALQGSPGAPRALKHQDHGSDHSQSPFPKFP